VTARLGIRFIRDFIGDELRRLIYVIQESLSIIRIAFHHLVAENKRDDKLALDQGRYVAGTYSRDGEK
jgi:hypothetical protein